MIEKGLMASGGTARSIEGQVTETADRIVMRILSDVTLRVLEEGRGPTVNRTGESKGKIRAWIDTKGITPDDPKMTKDQLAFVISRKIHREGIRVPNEHNPGKVISDVINDALISEIYTEVIQRTKNRIFSVTTNIVR